MELSPKLYHWLIRPKWFFDKNIGTTIGEYLVPDNIKILDFGCGVGSSCLITKKENYLGIDCDQKRIDYAKRLYPNYDFDTLKGKRIPVEDQSIDYILIICVLHHIPSIDLKGYVREFSRILKPNGKIIINEPCFFHNKLISNNFMSHFDKGNFIRNEKQYLSSFSKYFKIKTLKRYKQLLLYNKILLIATHINDSR